MSQLGRQRTVAVIPLSSDPSHKDGLLLTIQGRSVLDWTVDAMGRVAEISDVVVAEPVSNRLSTLRQALDRAPASDRVLFHEPNRPLTSAAGLGLFLREARPHPAATLVVPVKSTYKDVVEGRVRGTMPRHQLFQLQHVLVVDRGPFEAALHTAIGRSQVEGDEFALCQASGIPIQLIQGSFFNFPIAAKVDVEFAELALLKGLRLAP